METQSQSEDKLHPAVMDDDIIRNSGRDVGLIKPPLKSIAPASGQKGWNTKKDNVKILDDVSTLMKDNVGNDPEYPFDKIELGQGFFIPTQPNSTTDTLLANLHKKIHAEKQRTGEVEVNEEGDDIWERLTIIPKKRNDDGSIQMEGNKPVVGAHDAQRPKYIYTRNFIAKPVVKGQAIGENLKAEGDGVVVIRVA